MIQMIFRCPGTKGGWRRAARGGLEYKYEVPEYRLALEFASELFRSGMVHPDLVASRGADSKQLFCGGKIVAYEDGLGAWQGASSEQSTITPGFDMQPIPLFSAMGGEPLAWGSDGPIFYTFVKRGLGADRTREILRVLDWCAAPFGSYEYELNAFGVEGKHFTHAADGSPVPTDLGRQEIAGQFSFISGRAPAVLATADTPRYVADLFAYFDATIDHMEEDLFRGIKVTLPSSYSKLVTVTEDKLADVVRGRRPLGDLRAIVTEWRNAGGDETRAFLEKTLADNGR
jgi:putative aldouronate transport system substrate-binding protein